MKEPAWFTIGKKYLGVKELPGKRHNAVIVGWLRRLKAWWADDETPWCGVFVAECLTEAGISKAKNWFRALSWKDFGISVKPQLGAILVFARQGGGHVGFYAGEDKNYFYVLGGNQKNSVSYTWIAKERLTACRWPTEVPVLNTGQLLVNRRGQPISLNEA